MDVIVPSDVLPYVYTFLVSHNYKKAAKYLIKECKQALTLHTEVGADLVEWYQYYQDSHLGKRTAHILEEDAPPKKRRKKGTLAGDEERCGLPGDEEGCQIADRVVNGTVKKTRKRRREAESSAQGTEVKGQGLDERDVISKKKVKVAKRNKSVINNVDEAVCNITASNGRLVSGEVDETVCNKPSTNEVTSDSNDDDTGRIKKKDMPTTGETTPTNGEATPKSPATAPARLPNKRYRATPFRRVSDKVEVDPRLVDNSFEAKFNSHGSWGERANKDLKFTKGRSFRHEKTKKKRGTYKGGAIDTTVCSVKFDSD